jgi:pyruvate,water dikinase
VFDWVYPDAPEYEWELEREHWPQPFTPMEKAIWLAGVEGGDRAWAEVRLEAPHPFYRFQLAGPFLYARTTPYPMERMGPMAARYIEASGERGGALKFWKEFCEPRIKQVCDDLTAMDATADIAAAAEQLFYGFHQTFTCLALMFIPGMQLTGMLTEHNIADPELTGYEVTQGGQNATQDIDREIWELAELARSSPEVMRIVGSGADGALDALRSAPDAAAFVAAFDGLIARHSRRSQGWTLLNETWGERPDAVLGLVRAQLQGERVSPDEVAARTAKRRREATELTLAALPPDKHEQFRAAVAELDGYVHIREGRAYWQLVISGSMRGLLLRIGDALVQAGRLDAAADIFYVTPEDIAGGGDLRAVAAAGRAEWNRWCGVTPPQTIGTPGEAAAKAAQQAETPPDAEVLRGLPASRGQATARARVIERPEDGTRLQPGEILVCAMTTPAWTPLFAVAAGIVTETGGALSHPAITAREYGIPAVMAVRQATTRIRDGQTISIDGAAGTVSLR